VAAEGEGEEREREEEEEDREEMVALHLRRWCRRDPAAGAKHHYHTNQKKELDLHVPAHRPDIPFSIPLLCRCTAGAWTSVWA
jgi:hypothetical protein